MQVDFHENESSHFLKTTTGAAIALPNIISSHAEANKPSTPSGSALSVSANKVAGILAFFSANKIAAW